MTLRQLLLGIAILAGIFAVILLGLIGTYKFYPEMIGFPPNKQDSTKIVVEKPKPIKPRILKPVTVEETILITEQKLAMLEAGLLDKMKLSQNKDSLIKIEKYLKDSISRVNTRIWAYRDSVKKYQYSLDWTAKQRAAMSDSLNKIQNEYQKALDKVNSAKQRMATFEKMLESRADSLERKNFEAFAKIYNNSNPADVAKILEQLDEKDAARILKLMQKKKAGKIMDSMKPEKAAAILLLGAQ